MAARGLLRASSRECVRETSGGKRMEGDGARTGRRRGGERERKGRRREETEGEEDQGERPRERTQVREMESPGSGMGGMRRYAHGREG